MVAGVLVWLPLLITIWITWFFVSKFVFGVQGVIRYISNWTDAGVGFAPIWDEISRVGFSTFLVISLFFITGIVARHIVGRRIIAMGEKIVFVIPFVNKIYRAVQQIRDVFISRKGTVFQKVCLVEYPRKGVYAVAFITSHERGVVQRGAGEDLAAIFLPTTPNPTSGFLMYVRYDEIIELDISVEDAMKLIISGGAYHPSTYGEEAHVEAVAAAPASSTTPASEQ
jgi:uncharacterized membrane protein